MSAEVIVHVNQEMDDIYMAIEDHCLHFLKPLVHTAVRNSWDKFGVQVL